MNIDLRLVDIPDNITAGSVIVWNQDTQVLDTSQNLYKLLSKIMVYESELARANVYANSAMQQLKQNYAYNQDSVVRYNLCLVQLQELNLKLHEYNVAIVNDIALCDAYIATLNIKEYEAISYFKKLTSYLDLIYESNAANQSLKIELNVAEAQTDLLEPKIVEYTNKIVQIEGDLSRLEFSYLQCRKDVKSLQYKVAVATRDVLNLRTLAGRLYLKLQEIIKEVFKIEEDIETYSNKLCAVNAKVSLDEYSFEQQKLRIATLKERLEEFDAKLKVILCDIAKLDRNVANLQDLAEKIDGYIQKMIRFINCGLLTSGDNISITYSGNYATINSTLPDYPARPIPVRECIESPDIELTYPAPPCPPVLAPCPSPCPTIPACPPAAAIPACPACPACPPVVVTSTTTGTTTTTTSTPATTTCDCYYAHLQWAQLGTAGALHNFIGGSVTAMGYYAADYYWAGKLFSTQAAAEAYLANPNITIDGYKPLASGKGCIVCFTTGTGFLPKVCSSLMAYFGNASEVKQDDPTASCIVSAISACTIC